MGDIVIEDGDIFGDGVNVTARLEALAAPGGICVATQVREDAAGRRALEVAGDDASVIANAAVVLAYFGEDIGSMIALIDRALTLNPSFARGWYLSGVLRNWAGQSDVSIEHLKAFMRFSPRARVGWALYTIGASHFLARRFDEALPKLLLAVQDDPTNQGAYRFLAAC